MNYPKKRKSRLISEFALYRGDELLTIGNVDELAEYLGVKPTTVKFLSYPSYHKRFKENHNRVYAVPLDDNDDWSDKE